VGGGRLNGRDPIAIDDNCVVFQHPPCDGIEHTVWQEDLTCHEGSSWPVEQRTAPVPDICPRQLVVFRWTKGGCLNERRTCPICTGTEFDKPAYAYLLGLYLGDGCLSTQSRSSWKLRVVQDATYTRLISGCIRTMATVMGSDRIRWSIEVVMSRFIPHGSTGFVCSLNTVLGPNTPAPSS
jgi:hypothetical protein